MPKFLTIGYGEEAGYEATDPTVLAAAHSNDEKLASEGAIIGIAGKPIQVRNHDDKGISTKTGAYLSSALPIAGFAMIEADDLDDAIAKVAQSPCAIAHGVIEVWPLN